MNNKNSNEANAGPQPNGQENMGTGIKVFDPPRALTRVQKAADYRNTADSMERLQGLAELSSTSIILRLREAADELEAFSMVVALLGEDREMYLTQKARVAKLEAVLRWYADPESYAKVFADIHFDEGTRAREVLKEDV